ncbi:type II secretion system protein [Candidatus Saccharibacteria bacterium]|nr:type II secretion system protein [Candidatus Saccharibacteria bacterium]
MNNSRFSFQKNSTKNGFTILELIIVIVFASLALILFFVQKINVDAMDRDKQRKTAINAMYYALEEGFYEQNQFYPETINTENLTVIDPNLFTDPSGKILGENGCSYVYEAANCSDGRCKEYTLRASLEKEDDFIKKNRN